MKTTRLNLKHLIWAIYAFFAIFYTVIQDTRWEDNRNNKNMRKPGFQYFVTNSVEVKKKH